MELKNVAGRIEVSKVVTESFSVEEIEKQKHLLEDQLSMINRQINTFENEASKIQLKIAELNNLLGECVKLDVRPIAIEEVSELVEKI